LGSWVSVDTKGEIENVNVKKLNAVPKQIKICFADFDVYVTF